MLPTVPPFAAEVVDLRDLDLTSLGERSSGPGVVRAGRS
jgi:hypothetical protein